MKTVHTSLVVLITIKTPASRRAELSAIIAANNVIYLVSFVSINTTLWRSIHLTLCRLLDTLPSWNCGRKTQNN